MKKILFLLLSISLFACQKDSIDEPAPNNIRIFVSGTDTIQYSYNVYLTNDSTTFDTLSAPFKVLSGLRKDLLNSTYHYYNPIQIDMTENSSLYVIGYRTKTGDTLAHRYWFIPKTISKVVELPTTIY